MIKSLTTLEAQPVYSIPNGVATLEWEIPLSAIDFSPSHESINHFDLNNCQIALIPLRNSPDRALQCPSQHNGVSHMLLLPLTWKEFVTRSGGDISDLTSAEQGNVARFGEITINFLSMEVQRVHVPVSMTAMEFKVLKFFVLNSNRVISRDELLNEAWGYENYPCTRTVDNHVLKLRQKLEPDPGNPVHFRTIHGVGYKFVP